MGGAFIGVEDILWEDFFPHLFFGNSKYLTPLIGTLSTIPEKKSGLGLLNPVTSENEKYPSLKYASMELIWSVIGKIEFSNANHLLPPMEERRDSQEIRDDINHTKLKELVEDLDGTHCCLNPKIQKHRCLDECMGYYNNWYSTSGYGILWFLSAHYDVNPTTLQRKCDGCTTYFDVCHRLMLSKGGIVITRYKEVSEKSSTLLSEPYLLPAYTVKP